MFYHDGVYLSCNKRFTNLLTHIQSACADCSSVHRSVRLSAYASASVIGFGRRGSGIAGLT